MLLIYFPSGFASGRKQDRVPWKQIKENTNYFIEPRYLPEPMDGIPQLEDPSDMKKEQITRLLGFWRRPVHASDLFRFSLVLVNNKTEETTAALYKDSFAAVLSHPQNETVTTGDWDAEFNKLQAIGSMSPVPLPDTIDSALQQVPTSDPPLGVPFSNPTHPIDPILQHVTGAPTSAIGLTTPDSRGVPTPNPTHATPFDPNIDPILQYEAPTPAIGLTTPDSQGVPTVTPTHVVPTPSDGPVGSAAEPEQSQPSQPRPQPKKKTKNPIDTSQDPNLNPTSRQEEELGRPKRVQKRKVDLYLEAEQKTELAEKKKSGAKQKRKKWTMPENYIYLQTIGYYMQVFIALSNLI